MQGRGAALVAAALVGLLVALLSAPSSRAATFSCTPWNVRTIANGLGVLENLEPDGQGGLLISNNGANDIDRMTPDGHTSTLIGGVPSPGGERIRGGYL